MQTEKNIWLRMLSMILTLALLISCVPNQVYAMAGEALADWLGANDTAVLQPNATPDPVLSTAHIVAEDESRRGETYKEYVMNNGLRLATVYSSAIHYESNGQWKDIDNTLVSAVSGGKAVYQNAAGAWSVKFPQRLSGSDMISITKDSHTVQFGMAGEMRSTGDLVVASIGEIGRGETTGTLAISNAQVATAQIQQIDLTAARAAAEHPETVLEKLSSRLTYANVYPNTNVVYDLQGNQLKESVVLQRYDASLWGYRYTLNTGDLVPILREDQQIDLCHPKTNEVILTMPAPYMQDNNGETSYDVEVLLTRNGSNYLLSYYLPRAWLADTNRTWPVILDPIVSMYGDYNIVKDRTVCESATESYTDLTLECGHSNNRGVMRFFVEFTDLPELSSAEVILDAKITLKKPTNGTSDTVIEVHKIEEPWTSSGLSWTNMPRYNLNVVDYVVCKAAGTYAWNITSLVREWYNGDNNGMLFKASQDIEDTRNNNWKQFYSSDSGPTASNLPALVITYQDHNGLEDYWSYSSVSAGRAGTGYVNLFTGNLTWVRGDLGFDGNRMPVSISHVYNSNDSQSNSFGMGFGWKTNYNQTVTSPSSGVYVWEDGDGTRHYFYQAKDSSGNAISNTYLDEDSLHLTLTTGGSGNQTYTLTDQMGNKSYFDGAGRLCKMENNQQTKSNISITYTTTTGKLINTITDGVGRVYQFHYTAGLLDKISYMGSGNTELTYVTYLYLDGNLIRATDKDGNFTAYAYTEHLLSKSQDVSRNPVDDGYYLDIEYYVAYIYEEDSTGNPVTPIKEAKEYKSMDWEHSLSEYYTFKYYAHYTKVTDIDGKATNYQFNDFGNLVAAYNSDGHVQYTKYAINDVHELQNDLMAPTAELHQVLEISDIDGTSSNQFSNGSFENTEGSGDSGSNPFGWGSQTEASTDHAYRGNQSMKLPSDAIAYDFGYASGPGVSIEPGETYTFSAYIYAETNSEGEPSAYINFGGGKTYVLTGETNGWIRVQISHTNEGTETEIEYPYLRVFSGDLYIDCVQVENAGSSGPYNEVTNGEFLSNDNSGVVWVDQNDTFSANYYKNTDAPNLMLSSGSVGFTGDPTQVMYLEQLVPVSGAKGDAFVLSGWAQANALPLTGNRQFGLKLIFHNLFNSENPTTEYYVSFDPDISFDPSDHTDRWQYAALTAVAKEAFSHITIQLIYNYQANAVYFDGIQLTEGRAGNTYTYDENKNVVEETNILGQITKYKYHDNGVDLKEIEPSVGSIVKYEVYDAYHNVINMKETVEDESEAEHTVTYEYAYDEYGNVTSVTVTQGTLKMKSTTAYTSDGNYIKATTDGTGKTTRYGYHLQTGVLKWVQYPEDTPGTADTEDAEGTEGTESTEYVAGTTDTRTYYVYDEMFRLIETYVTTDKNDTMYAQYEYENELLKELWTQSTVYRFTYNYYNLRTSVSVGDLELARYSYNSKHYLTQLDFANDDSVKYRYDSLGRITREEYYENGNTTTPSRTIRYYYDNGGALARMKDSETGMETWSVYDYAGRVIVYYEICGDTSREIIYTYDENGNITKVNETAKDYRRVGERIVADTSIYGYEYFYDYKNRLETVKTYDGQKDYHYDSLDRLTEEVVKTINGTEVLSNNYNYKSATVGGTYVTTNQVYSKIVTADYYQKNFIYGYDDNGNIVSVGDGTRSIRYEYDSANQLIRENNPYENRTWVWTYDAAGNITSKKEYTYTTVATEDLGNPIDSFAYTYSNADWGDLLTAYDGLVIQYDEIGNPLSDGKWEYTWKQGRQLATMSDGETTWTYTYDANGMRLSRTTGTGEDDVTYTYVYTDGLLSRMTKGDITLYFAYDAAGTPLTVSIHTGTYCRIKRDSICGGNNCKVYYYVTNIQGDVIAILDETGNEVAEYSYDAWGRLLCDLDEDEETIYSLNPLLYRGYVYDRETGLYYLQSRYYDPEIGRFINADDIGYLGADGTLQSYNLFAYCGNNPVNRIDPTGNWSWETFWTGVGMVATAATAIALSVTTFGAGIPLAMSMVAGVTLGAGVLTGINGAATIIEAYTEYNFVRDSVFQGNETAYSMYAGITEGVAAIGCMVLGAYHSTGHYKAARHGQKYLGNGYRKAGPNRWVSKDGMRQMIFDDTHHMLDGVKTTNHFNLSTHASDMRLGRSPIVSKLHVFYDTFSIWFK